MLHDDACARVFTFKQVSMSMRNALLLSNEVPSAAPSSNWLNDSGVRLLLLLWYGSPGSAPDELLFLSLREPLRVCDAVEPSSGDTVLWDQFCGVSKMALASCSTVPCTCAGEKEGMRKLSGGMSWWWWWWLWWWWWWLRGKFVELLEVKQP